MSLFRSSSLSLFLAECSFAFRFPRIGIPGISIHFSWGWYLGGVFAIGFIPNSIARARADEYEARMRNSLFSEV